MKIVVNKCYGGFSVSLECAEYMASIGCERSKKLVERHNKKISDYRHWLKTGEVPETEEGEKLHTVLWEIHKKYKSEPEFYGYGYCEGFDDGFERDSEYLVKAVEHLGNKASGSCAELQVVDIPDGVEWQIEEYDGLEWIAEKHRTW